MKIIRLARALSVVLVLGAPAFMAATPAVALQFVGGETPAEVARNEMARLSRFDVLLNSSDRHQIVNAVQVMEADFGGRARAEASAADGNPKALYTQAIRQIYGVGMRANPGDGAGSLQQVANGEHRPLEQSNGVNPYRHKAAWMLYQAGSRMLADDANLAAMSAHVDIDEGVRREYLIGSANAGIPHAQHQLAEDILSANLGLDRSVPLALYYFSLAKESKFAPSVARHAEVAADYVEMRRQQEVKQRIVQGDRSAISELADMLDAGEGIEQNHGHAEILRRSLKILK